MVRFAPNMGRSPWSPSRDRRVGVVAEMRELALIRLESLGDAVLERQLGGLGAGLVSDTHIQTVGVAPRDLLNLLAEFPESSSAASSCT